MVMEDGGTAQGRATEDWHPNAAALVECSTHIRYHHDQGHSCVVGRLCIANPGVSLVPQVVLQSHRARQRGCGLLLILPCGIRF
jgi:hypothetical protein